MVRVHLDMLLVKKKWKQTDLSRATGIRYNTINDLYHEMADRISFDHINRICEVLECEIQELIEFIPDKKKKDFKKND